MPFVFPFLTACLPRRRVVDRGVERAFVAHSRGEETMNEQDFQNKLGELMKQIENLPPSERGPLEKLAAETRERHDKMKKTVGELQESLDYLRLSVKYLVFDLEATRRENEYLRKLIETRSSQDQTPDNEAAD
jgi:predicted  nucleic acid-binding Zn-ribbon protein